MLACVCLCVTQSVRGDGGGAGPYLGWRLPGGFWVWPAVFELGGAGHTLTERLHGTNRQGHQCWRLFESHVQSSMRAHAYKHTHTHTQACMQKYVQIDKDLGSIHKKKNHKKTYWESVVSCSFVIILHQTFTSYLKLLFRDLQCRCW